MDRRHTRPRGEHRRCPRGDVASASAIVSFGSEPGTSFECGLDEVAFMPCSSPIEYAGLPDGERVVSVRATDAAGNAGAAVDAAWIVDTNDPCRGLQRGSGAAHDQCPPRRVPF